MRFEAERAIILPTKSSRVYKGDDRMLIILEKIGWGMLALTGFVGGRSGIGKVPCQAPNQKARTDQSGTRLSKLIKQKGF